MDPLGTGCGSQEIHGGTGCGPQEILGAHFGNQCSSRYIRADGQKEGIAWLALALAFENFRLLMPQGLPLQRHKLSHR